MLFVMFVAVQNLHSATQ